MTTDRPGADQSLHESEEKLRKVIAASHAAISINGLLGEARG